MRQQHSVIDIVDWLPPRSLEEQLGSATDLLLVRVTRVGELRPEPILQRTSRKDPSAAPPYTPPPTVTGAKPPQFELRYPVEVVVTEVVAGRDFKAGDVVQFILTDLSSFVVDGHKFFVGDAVTLGS